MKFVLLSAIICFTLASHAQAVSVPLPPTPEELAAQSAVQADEDFASDAQIKGVARAFRDRMALDGQMFGGPKPLSGAKAIYEALGGETPTFKLEWVPTGAWGSKGGDMAVTTGDWRRIPVDSRKPVTTGRYVTVWQRVSSTDPWRVLIDIGETDDKPIANAVGAPLTLASSTQSGYTRPIQEPTRCG